jgi:alkanesulfonate monooxygenase SsuD/methylene tetrahydromethanopterin reductase-like flavin-dependent oxidoreductase (luciferase family)
MTRSAGQADVTPDVKFCVTYALRNFEREDHHEFLQRQLDQICAVEAMGYDEVRIAEHHFIEDGYVPCPLIAGTAIAMRTSRIAIGQHVLLAPFYHPVRLAEEACYLDNLSGGRFSLTMALGYRGPEFTGYGMRKSERGERAAETMAVVLKCLQGEKFSHSGKYYQLEGVDIRPRPYQQPRFPVWVGAHSRPAMERAARLGIDGMVGSEGDLSVWREVNDELRPGVPTKFAAPLPVNLVPSEDPQRDWALYRDNLARPVRIYAQWADESGDNQRVSAPRFGEQKTDEDLRRVARFATPDEILSTYLERIDSLAEYDTILVCGQTSELPADVSLRAFELYAEHVMPVLKARIAQTRQRKAVAAG